MFNLKFFCEHFPPHIVKQAKQELGETEEIREKCLADIKALIKEEPDFQPRMEDAFLLRFLRVRKFNVERAFKSLKNHYRFKALHSGILTDFKPSDVEPFLSLYHTVVLEYRHNSIPVGVTRIAQYEKDKVTPDQIISMFAVLVEISLSCEVNQCVGYHMIWDLADISLRMVKQYASPTLLYRMMEVALEYIPFRIKSVHIVNEPIYFKIIFKLIRTLAPKKIMERTYLHGDNFKSLHNYISPEILPEELGGKQGPMSKFAKEYVNKLLSYEDHFIKINKYGYQGDTLQRLRKGNSKAIVT